VRAGDPCRLAPGGGGGSRLLGLHTWLDPAFGYDEEDPLGAAIESEHPDCGEHLPELIAQVTEALAVCQASDAFAEQLRPHCGPECPKVFAEVADRAYAHLAREHRGA